MQEYRLQYVDGTYTPTPYVSEHAVKCAQAHHNRCKPDKVDAVLVTIETAHVVRNRDGL